MIHFDAIIHLRRVHTLYVVLMLACCVSCSRSQDGAPDEGFTPLTDAVAKHDYQRVKWLLNAGADANQPSYLGASPLCIAATFDDTEMISLLLDHNANVNESPSKYGNKSLAEVTARDDALGSLEILYAHGLLIQQTNENGESLLNVATESNSLKVSGFLLQHGLDPNSRDSFSGQTPLCSAVNNVSPAMVTLLLSDGANPNFSDLAGYTPLMDIVLLDTHKGGYGQLENDLRWFGDSSQVSRHRRCVQIMTNLLMHGAKPNLARNDGFTPLHFAAMYCDSSLARVLIQRGADRNAMASGGYTPLKLAKKHGCEGVISVLHE